MYHTSTHTQQDSITIRTADARDTEAVRRLAERDSAAVPAGRLLVALVDDEVRAAVSIDGEGQIADPFHHSVELLRLLSERASQLHPPTTRTRMSLLSRALGRRQGHPALSPQSAGTMRTLD